MLSDTTVRQPGQGLVPIRLSMREPRSVYRNDLFSGYNTDMPSERNEASENPYDAPRHPSDRVSKKSSAVLIVVATALVLIPLLLVCGGAVVWLSIELPGPP